MTMKFKTGWRYRMPVVFGPSTGPRQGVDGKPYDYRDSPKIGVHVSYLTDASRLEGLLPPGFTLSGEPIVTVEIAYLTELPWLAGRGYNTLGVKFPVRYEGTRDAAVGPFLAVLWENRPEPILTGREELGFAKLFCEIPAPRVLGAVRDYSAVWDGHEFMRLRLSDLRDAPPPPPPRVDGTLHYRYVPKVGSPGEAEIEQAVITPIGGVQVTLERYQTGIGAIEFVRSTWEQLPTMVQVVNTLADLPVLDIRDAGMIQVRGAKDLSDQRPLR